MNGAMREVISVINSSNEAKSTLKAFIEHDTVLVHRTKSVPETFSSVDALPNRKPTNTPYFVHDYVDTIIEHTHGHPYRSVSMFTYADRIHSRRSGSCVVLPLGSEVRAYYVKGVSDFYNSLLAQVPKISERVVTTLSKSFVVPWNISASMSAGIRVYLETYNSPSEVFDPTLYFADVIHTINGNLARYISGEEFENMVRGYCYDAAESIIKDGQSSTIMELIGSIQSEEVMVNAPKYLLISMNWIDNLAKEMGTSRKSVLSSLVDGKC